MSNGLTDKQQAFIYAYLSNGFNATRAAIDAGYSEKTARSQGQRLLTNVDIARSVRDGMSALAMPAYEVLARIAEQARSTMEDFLDDAGDIDLKRARERGKLHLVKTRAVTKEGERIELYSAQSALELLAKHHALLTENVNLAGELKLKGYTTDASPDDWEDSAE